jgi:hypothetical protein
MIKKGTGILVAQSMRRELMSAALGFYTRTQLIMLTGFGINPFLHRGVGARPALAKIVGNRRLRRHTVRSSPDGSYSRRGNPFPGIAINA